MTLSIVYSAYQ